MKRFLATILSFILLAGCAQNDAENTIVQRDNGEPFYGSFEYVNATRTYVNEAMTMLWHADDRISLFRSTLNEEFKFTGETGDSAGDFEEIPSEIFVTGAEISTNYGVYPYNSTTTISEDETITLTMPSVQAYAQNSFGCGANTAVAATENSSSRFLPFRNVGGFLVVKIYSPSGVVKSVELKGNNGEVLAGEATVQAKYGYLPLLTMGDGTDSITLDCGGGVEVGTTEDSATHFWFVVPPTTFEEGFTVSVTDTAGAVTTKSTTKRNEILRNEVTVMSAFEIAETDSKPKPANNEIWYTAPAKLELYDNSVFGATYLSNIWDSETGRGVITFDGDVTTIGDFAFADCTSLTSVTIPDSVTTIGDFAFAGCSSLTSVTIPDSVTTIGDYAFITCTSLTSVTIPDSVTEIGDSAFEGCTSLTSVYCKATTPPSGGYYMFEEIASNSKIYVPTDSVVAYKEANGWSDYADYIVGYNFENGEVDDEEEDPSHPANPANNEIWYINGSTTEPTDPHSLGAFGDATIVSNEYDSENGYWVITFDRELKTIGDFAFYNCSSLASVTIGNSVTTIGEQAFYGCDSLTSITIPDSVTTIGDYAFYYCTSLTSVTIGDSVTTIGDGAFYSCESLTSVTIGDSVTTIGEYAFQNCSSLASVTIGNSVTTIGEYAFSYCDSLTSVTIPDSVTTIGNGAFSGCDSLTSVTIPDSVTEIGDYAFYYCYSLTSVTIGDSVTTIGDYAFEDCESLTSITIPDSVTTIGESAFRECYSLTSITIPDSVTTIGEGAFAWCSSLTSVYCKPTIPPTGNYAMFDHIATDLKIYVPAGYVESYRISNYWSDYADYIVGYNFENGEVDDEEEDPSHPANPANSEIWYTNGSTINSTEPLPDSFGDAIIVSNEYDIEKGHWVITFDKEVKEIGNSAFSHCRSLTSITIPDSVTTIGDYTFYYCTSLTSVTIPDSVTEIGDSVFECCTSLIEIIIGKSVVVIGRRILDSCESLRSVYCKPTTPPTSDSNSINFIGCDTTNVTLYVPVESMNSYVNHDSWEFYNDIMAPYNYETEEIVSTSIISYGGEMIEFDEEAFDANIIAHYYYYNNYYSGYRIIFDGVITTIGEGAFYRANHLTSISIPESVTSIGEGAFAESGLHGIGIPGSVKEIGSYAFAYCQYLTGVSIDKGVTKIGSNAFALCIGLSDITIPDSVTTIGYGAFSQCSRLKKVYCKATTPPSGDSDMFEDNAPGLTIYVPTDSVEAYKKAYGWRDYADAIVGYNF